MALLLSHKMLNSLLRDIDTVSLVMHGTTIDLCCKRKGLRTVPTDVFRAQMLLLIVT